MKNMVINSLNNENNLVEKMMKYLLEKGYKVKENVPNLNRCADIVAINDENEIIVFECKINDYKKAIEQLNTHKLCADKVYIVSYYKNIQEKTKDQIIKNEIGLIFINENGDVNIAEYCNENTGPKWNIGKKLLRNYITGN